MINIEAKYDILIDHIHSPTGQCVLVLGPELSVNRDGVDFRTYFKKMVAGSGLNIMYFEEKNLFWYEDKTDSAIIKKGVKEFYKNVEDPALLQLLCRIKFPLIINASPDVRLNEEFGKLQIPFTEDHFQTGLKNKLPYPSKDHPVIYNIFGSVHYDSSLMITHGSLFEAMEYLLPKGSLPDNIELFLENQASSFLFLGFKFESWQYQLMCHKLGIHKGDSKMGIAAPGFKTDMAANVVMTKHFPMNFAEENASQTLYRLIKSIEKLGGKSSLRDYNANGKYSVFVSYAGNDKESGAVVSGQQEAGSNASERDASAIKTNPLRAAVVDLLQVAIPSESSKYTNEPLQFIRDTEALDYGSSIDSFMTRIGLGRTVIRVISDKYLKSVYCMKEAMRIARYRNSDNRVFTILLDDVNTNDAETKQYSEYWLGEIQKILTEPHKLLNGSYDDYVNIYRFIESFMVEVKDSMHIKLKQTDLVQDSEGNTLLVPEKQAEFDRFIQHIITKVREE
jgi:hypothetical protein